MINMTAQRFGSGAAVVAGGSGGIGAAICKTLAEMGSDVALTYRNGEDRANAVVKEVEALGRKAIAVKTDLLDVQSVTDFVAQANETFDGVHTAVYAAGPLLPLGIMAEITPQRFQEVVSTDLFGCHNFLYASAKPLIAAKGAMVAVVTPAMVRWAVTDALSAVPKAAVQQIIRGFAFEHGREGLRANCVGIGLVHGGMVLQMMEDNVLSEEHTVEFANKLPIQRMGTPEDVASAVGFLASDLSSYTTGQTIMVDGGFSI